MERFDLAKALRRGYSESEDIHNQATLASKIGVVSNYVSKNKTGKNPVTIKMLKKYAEAFDVKLSVFISWGE